MTAIKMEQSHVGWGLWLKWVVASSIGWTASFILSISVIGAVVQALWGDPDTVLAEGTLAFHTALTCFSPSVASATAAPNGWCCVVS